MKITALEAFRVDGRLIALWNDAGYTELLPIQEEAVRKGRILEGGNAVIFAPTSSGKTFAGEIAAVQTALRDRRVIYLVPQKALAEEKYREFREKYTRLGIRTVISTRDRKEHDDDVRRGHFNIAVIVFEKMHALLVSDPTVLRDVGLVIVDELQMLADKTRGPALELMLTKVLLAPEKPQLICLSAVLGNAKEVARWIGGTLCEDHKRPIELRKGVLYKGKFLYLEHNSGATGAEELGPSMEGAEAWEILVEYVRLLAGRGEQCLVFCRSKCDSIATARAIAEAMAGPPSKSTVAELTHLEDSEGRECLLELSGRRVAYHNADLDCDQREIIERGFRSGDIMVLCATSTLAMGINLPARNVFIDTRRWELDPCGKWCTVKITQGEYENSSGRAGRLGLEKDFGRAVIIAETEFDEMVYSRNYVRGQLGDLEPALAAVPLSQHALNLVASGLCRSEDEVRSILLASYTGSRCWRSDQKAEAEFAERLRKAVQQCVKSGLITADGDSLVITKLGEVAAAKGISVKTAVAMAAFARERAEVAASIDPLEVLWCLAGTEDGEAIHVNLSTEEYRSGEYPAMLQDAMRELAASARNRLTAGPRGYGWSYEATQCVKKTLLLYEWINGVSTRTIESRFQCYSGTAYGLGGEFAWLADAMAGIVKVFGWPEDIVSRIGSLVGQLIHGIEAEGLALVSIRVRGFRRGRIKALVAKGWDTPEKLAAAPAAELYRLLSRPVAERVLKRIRPSADSAEMTMLSSEPPPADPASPPQGVVSEHKHADETLRPDKSGAHYRSNAVILLDGMARQRRYLVLVDGKEAWLTSRSFQTALMLALEAKKGGLGWLAGFRICRENYHQIIRRLKADLRPTGVDADKLVENNTAKGYRLSVPPQNITWDEEKIQFHASDVAGLLAGGEDAA